MIEFIFGAKGSGKTKKMIDLANEELATTKGSVLFVNDRDHYRATVDRQIRFINTDEYNISDTSELYGFLCGLMASNYDISAIFVDNLLRIINGEGPKSVEDLLNRLEKLDSSKDIKFVLSISTDEDSIPDFLKNYNQ